MRKIGKLISKSLNKTFVILWYGGTGSFERIDITETPDSYNVINTESCEASYYKHSSELFLGNKNLITNVFKIKHSASLISSAEKKTMNVEDGLIYLTIEKEHLENGLKYKIVMVNGKLYSEYYESPDGIIDITRIENDGDADMRPVNISQYESMDREGKVKAASTNLIRKTSTAEYRSYDELLRIYPQVSHVLEEDYVVIESYEEAEERLNTWINSKEQLKSFDIESLHEHWGIYSDNAITGIFLGLGEHWSTYFPFRQENFEYNLPIEYLRKIFNAINNQPKYPEVIILGHNVKFEIEGFYQEYREMIRFDIDTYLLSVLENPIVKKGSHTLKSLTAKVDKRFYLSLNQIFIGKIAFNVLPPEIVKIYGCPDATSPAKLYKYFLNKIPKDEHFVIKLEMQLPYIKALNEFYGLRMDQERLNSLIANEEYKIQTLGDMFRRIHRTSRNINSYKVLKEILYDKLRCPVEVRTNKGLPATSKVAIDRIVELGTLREYDKTNMPADIIDLNGKVIISGETLAKNKYPSLVIYQTYKKALKEIGALRRLKTHSDKDRFMFYINQSGAGSNRQTSDAHQFSDTMKSCVISDSPYHKLVSCDWKQVELRVLAWLAGQEDLIKLEADPDVDIHRAILSIIQGKPMYMISEEDRKNGKSVNFGVVYMMSEYGLAKKDFGPAYTKEELRIEMKKITDFYNGLPYIKKYVANNEKQIRENGYIKTKFNYYRYFPEMLDPLTTEKEKKSLVRAGNNTPVQGTAAQMLKIVESKIYDYIQEKGWNRLKNYNGVELPIIRMMLPIHDEILLSYDDSEISIEEIVVMFKECMELNIKGAPPFFAAPSFAKNWDDAHSAVNELDIGLRDRVVEEYKKGISLLTGKDYNEVIKEFRSGELRQYMMSLIAKYKTVDEVASHVTHDALTHTLIETMIPEKSERKALSHVERIYEATKRYMETAAKGIDIKDSAKDSSIEDAEYRNAFMDAGDWLMDNARIDSNGDLVQEEDYEEDTDVIEHELLPIEERDVPMCRVLYMLEECWIDLTGFDVATTGQTIHEEIQKLCNPSEFYNIIYIVGNKTVRTNLKIGYEIDKLEALFSKIESEE